MQKILITAIFILSSVSCAKSSSKNYLPSFVPKNKITDLNTESFDPKADILFIVDNSGSMGSHQSNLANNISLFTQVFLTKSVLNYNIAVISTDDDGWAEPSRGRFAGAVRVVSKTTPNADMVLSNNLRLGTSGSYKEKIFDPLHSALSEPLISGHNAGFLREDAALIVIIITDAEDQSDVNIYPQDTYDFMLKLKKGNKRKIMGYGAIVPTGVTGCARDEWTDPKRLETFLGLFKPDKSNVLSLCANDYGARLATFADEIVDQVGSTIYLSRAPVPSSIRVTYGDMELPMHPDYGWAYNPETNAIHLGAEIDWASQPDGSKVEVNYNAAHFDEEHPN